MTIRPSQAGAVIAQPAPPAVMLRPGVPILRIFDVGRAKAFYVG